MLGISLRLASHRAISVALLVAATIWCEGAEQSTPDVVLRPAPVVLMASPDQSGDSVEYLISAAGIGAIRLGQTMSEVRQAMPNAEFKRISNGVGAALVEVSFAPDTAIIISADEDDPDAPIDWSKTVLALETFSPAFHTVEGIRPGMLVIEAEEAWGPVKAIVKSEIESREYITFKRQPAALTLRLNSTGEFPDGSNQTQKFATGAEIYSITVSSFGTE